MATEYPFITVYSGGLAAALFLVNGGLSLTQQTFFVLVVCAVIGVMIGDLYDTMKRAEA